MLSARSSPSARNFGEGDGEPSDQNQQSGKEAKSSCVKAHVLVAFLDYALWVTLKHLLQRRAPMDRSHP